MLPDPSEGAGGASYVVKPPGRGNRAGRTVWVAFLVSFVCSLLVASVTIALRPQHEFNREHNRQQNVLAAAGLLQPGADITELFNHVEMRIVDLETGTYVSDETLAEDLDRFATETMDPRRLGRDPTLIIDIPEHADLAGIERRARHAVVYIVRDAERITTVVLPVYGHGLWSMLYGYLAIGPDADTIVGLRFYDHGETPGLGGQIDDPRWLAEWPGQHVHGPSGEVSIEVQKGRVRPGPRAVNQVDGITGATLTGNAVTALLRYWLGDHAFGPYLANLRDTFEEQS